MSRNEVLHTLDLKPRNREAIKPAELIQITGHHELTLNARRAITILWYSAHMQGIEDGRDYTVEIDDLKPDSHKGYERVEEAVEALMRTLLVVKMANGKTRRVAFLGGNDIDDPDRPAGVLTYSFDRRLIEVLRNSTIWGKIALPVLMAFTSKYAVSLYENLSQLVNLEFKTMNVYSLDAFREMLGVQPGRYRTFGELNKHVIQPAVEEINALASFSLNILPVKQGKKVAEIHVSWWQKDASALKAAWQEVNSTKIGRRARIAGNTVSVLPAHPSKNRTTRQGMKAFASKTS